MLLYSPSRQALNLVGYVEASLHTYIYIYIYVYVDRWIDRSIDR